MEKWSTEDNFVVYLGGRGGFHLFHLFQWWNNCQPSWQHWSNTVHHCTSERRSLFINIKPIWAEKLQCPNDVYTSALMSLLSDIAAPPAAFPSVRLRRKINDPVLPEPNNIMWHLQKAKKQRLKHSNFQRSAICEFRGNTAQWEEEKKSVFVPEVRNNVCIQWFTLCRTWVLIKLFEDGLAGVLPSHFGFLTRI